MRDASRTGTPSTPAAAEGPLVRCAGVVRIYATATGETHALRGVDAEFRGGTFTAVTGPSGSGKSSLLQLLALRERPSGGEVRVLGADLASSSAGTVRRLRRGSLAWVPQRPSHAVLGHLTAAEHLDVVARQRDATPDDVLAVLAAVDLSDRAGVRASLLSGGEQQRLAVAAACLGGPLAVVADEPTAELDDESAARVGQLLAARAAAGGVVVVATHDARLVARADRVLHLRHGVLSTESSGGRALAAIDPSGRVQLPPEALALFPTSRAVVVVQDGSIRLVPPPVDDADGTEGDAL